MLNKNCIPYTYNICDAKGWLKDYLPHLLPQYVDISFPASYMLYHFSSLYLH